VLESTLKEYVMLSKKTKEILTVAMANEKAAKELASAIEELQAKVAELEEELEEEGE
jgi:outer membrane murein-binding lipoprotein Lpp